MKRPFIYGDKVVFNHPGFHDTQIMTVIEYLPDSKIVRVKRDMTRAMNFSTTKKEDEVDEKYLVLAQDPYKP